MWWSNWVSVQDFFGMEGAKPPRVGWSTTQEGHRHHIVGTRDCESHAVSISCGEKTHPFPDGLLNKIRQCLGATEKDGVAEGQPFFLTLISKLPQACGQPCKEELAGAQEEWEDLSSPVGRHNYDSAEVFADSTKETFIEERERERDGPCGRPLHQTGSGQEV